MKWFNKAFNQVFKHLDIIICISYCLIDVLEEWQHKVWISMQITEIVTSSQSTSLKFNPLQTTLKSCVFLFFYAIIFLKQLYSYWGLNMHLSWAMFLQVKLRQEWVVEDFQQTAIWTNLNEKPHPLIGENSICCAIQKTASISCSSELSN